MLSTRVRVGPLLEWLCAAALIVGAIAAGTMAVGDWAAVRGVTLTPVIARETPAFEPPPTIAPGSVAVPLLPLRDGTQIRVGELLSGVTHALGPLAQVGADAFDRVGASERLTRAYNYVGLKFTVVFEAARAGAEPRIVAIYRN